MRCAGPEGAAEEEEITFLSLALMEPERGSILQCLASIGEPHTGQVSPARPDAT
jgi:hypothetical protein